MADSEAMKLLQTIPSIGKACALDLYLLGFRNPTELKGRNPAKMYTDLNRITGKTHDICVLYTFRCTVYYCTEANPESEKLRWWYWKDHTYLENIKED